MSEKEEKLVVRKATISLRRKYGRTKQINIVERDAFVPKKLEKEIRNSILKKKSILATDIALKFDIRVSTAKLLLKLYEEEGLIKELLEYATDITCQFIRLMAQTGAHMVSNGDSNAGPELISAEMYEKFAYPMKPEL